MNTKIIKHISTGIIILMSGFLSFSSADAKKISTRVNAPKEDSAANYAVKLKTYPYHETEFEKISGDLTFMAYDKKAGSDKETFFVDNGSDENLSAIEIEISYFNKEGKLIHKRTVEVKQDFPHKETRKVDISSWDKQKSYHYINSVPSTKGSTPYTVRFKVLSFIKS